MKYLKMFESFDNYYSEFGEDENLILDLFTEYADKYSLLEIDKDKQMPIEEDVVRYNGCYMISPSHHTHFTMYIKIFNGPAWERRKIPNDFVSDIESFAEKLKINGFSFSEAGTFLGSGYWNCQPLSNGTIYRLYHLHRSEAQLPISLLLPKKYY